jgi:acetyl-CoA carboxylase biotin carboxyl carrier protein
MSEDTDLPDLRYVRELAKVFKQYGLDEIELETSGSRILLRRGGSGVPVAISAPAPAPAPAAAPAPAPAAAAPAPAPAAEEGSFITSPFVGTFYTAPRPDADAFVKVGQTVSEGDTVCIVEAMKLFNEIESEFPCVIEEILVENAQPVEYGAKLFRVRRL